MNRLLVIEDSDEIRGQLRWGLGKDYEVLTATNRGEAMMLFRKHSPPVVTLDLGLPPDEEGSSEGLRCLEEILQDSPSTKVVIITGNDFRENAHAAVQRGAYDYYHKPIDLNELRGILKRAYYLAEIEEENSRLQKALVLNEPPFSGIIGQSPKMLQMFSTVRKVASSDVPVLVTGESGTGKEVVARAIHSLSLRKGGPFIPINCGAIPENLMESELFCFEKGAFSGAHTRVQGKVEFAHKGTLFLDEIGDLPLNLQVKLLRFLQEKVIQRVGGREDIVIDSRIIAATNKDIGRATETGSFREDLYYRIAVIHLDLPPLRTRGEDIIILANMFLRKFSGEYGKKPRGLSTATIKLLESYDWPGNVRELENRLQRAVLMSDSSLLEPADLGFINKPLRERNTVATGLSLRDARDRFERELISAAIEKQGNNMARTAEMLGISRPTLYDLVRKHGLSSNGHQSLDSMR